MEIEIRARVKNLDLLEKRLVSLGGILEKTVVQKDIYFGEINLYKKIGYSFLLRVRAEGKKVFLTYKGAKKKKDGAWEEYEYEIKNFDRAVEMLRAMGLDKVIEVKKTRKQYSLDGISICLDSIVSFGDFVEIEYLGDDCDKSRLKDLMNSLGISDKDIIHKGYISLMLAEKKSPYSKYIKN